MPESPVERPSEVLRRAADLIRDRAAFYAEWETGWQESPGRFDSTLEAWLYSATDRNAGRYSKEWIASMSPALAPHLEAILRDEADHYERFAGFEPPPFVEHVLALARAVLGKPSGGHPGGTDG